VPQPAPQTTARPAAASACGKAIIVGEHAVVYGARAVAVPLTAVGMHVKLTPRAAEGGGAPLVRAFLGGRSVSDHLRGVIDEAFTALGLAPFALDLECVSSVLVGAGLGSSAALCIVILRALAASCGMTLTPAELASLGNGLERRFHGNPSGLDTAVVAHERTLVFRKGEPPAPLRVEGAGAPRRPFPFALLDTGARSSTMAMVQIAAPYFQGARGQARVERFDALVTRAAAGLSRGGVADVADAMTEAGALLAEAGVVGDVMRDVIDTALAAGALAAKPTGAGGGGCVLALLDPADSAAQLATLRERLGATRVFGVEVPA
jgi:mevalonate kinase